MADFDRIREEGERISREEGYKVLLAEIAARDKEIEHLRDQAKAYAKLLREVADDLDGKPLGGLEVVVRRTECPTGSE